MIHYGSNYLFSSIVSKILGQQPREIPLLLASRCHSKAPINSTLHANKLPYFLLKDRKSKDYNFNFSGTSRQVANNCELF